MIEAKEDEVTPLDDNDPPNHIKVGRYIYSRIGHRGKRTTSSTISEIKIEEDKKPC